MRAGVRALEQGLTLALATPDAERATVAELGGRLIGQLVPAGALGGAGDTLASIEARFPGLVLRDAKGPIDLAAIKADLAGRMSLSRRWPTAGLPTATDTAQVLQGWALIDPMLKPTSGGVPPLVAMRHADGRLAVFGVPAADGPAGELLTPRWTLDRSDGMEVVKLDAKTVLLFDRDGAVLQRASVVEGVDDGWLAKPFSEYFLAQGGEAGGGGRPGVLRPGGLPRARATFSAQGFRAPGDMFRPYEELLICATDRTIAIVERTGRAVLLDAISGGLLFAGEIGLRQVHDVQLAGTSLIAAGVARDERAGAGAPVDGAGMDVILVVDARSGAMVRSITPSADLGGVRWVRTNERADIIAGCAKGIASFDPETAAVGWSLLSSDSPAAAATDAWLVGSRLVLLADDRRMYLANTTAGQITPQVLNMGSRAESYGPIYVSRSMLAVPLSQGGAGQGGAGQAGAGVGGGALIPPGSELVAIRSSNGLAIIDVDGRVVGGDAISSSETVLPPVPIDGGYLAIARESKGDVTGGGAGGAGKQLAAFELTLLDGRSGAAMATVSLMLGAVPARMAVIDNRVIVTAGHTSVVYKTK